MRNPPTFQRRGPILQALPERKKHPLHPIDILNIYNQRELFRQGIVRKDPILAVGETPSACCCIDCRSKFKSLRHLTFFLSAAFMSDDVQPAGATAMILYPIVAAISAADGWLAKSYQLAAVIATDGGVLVAPERFQVWALGHVLASAG